MQRSAQEAEAIPAAHAAEWRDMEDLRRLQLLAEGEVLERVDLVSRMEPFSRCLRCNTPLVPADADAIAAQLPPRTRAAFRQFHRCPGCHRVYWQGSHYDRLVGVVERARERVATRTR
jgi:uncharacterized protein with PIN domain